MTLRDHGIQIYLLIPMVFLLSCDSVRPEEKTPAYERLSQIVQAIKYYEENLGAFPPASLIRDGKSMHSWRTLIVPYLESNRFYNRYDLDSAWNADRNANLMTEMGEVTQVREVYCGKMKDFKSKIFVVLKKSDGETPYRASHVRYNSGWTMRSATLDGWMVLVELELSNIHWMEPKDYFIEEILDSAELKSRLRSLALIRIETKETEFLIGSQEKVLERLESLAKSLNVGE